MNFYQFLRDLEKKRPLKRPSRNRRTNKYAFRPLLPPSYLLLHLSHKATMLLATLPFRMVWLCLLFTPTSFASTIPPYTSPSSTLSRQQVSSPPFTDLAHLLEYPTQLRLDRTPYSSQYHARKPYLLTEPDAEYANTLDTLPSSSCSTTTPLPKAPVSLTGIPKDYGYTASFSIGTYPSSSSSSHSGPFNLLIDTGSDLTVVTSAPARTPSAFRCPTGSPAPPRPPARPPPTTWTGPSVGSKATAMARARTAHWSATRSGLWTTVEAR